MLEKSAFIERPLWVAPQIAARIPAVVGNLSLKVRSYIFSCGYGADQSDGAATVLCCSRLLLWLIIVRVGGAALGGLEPARKCVRPAFRRCWGETELVDLILAV